MRATMKTGETRDERRETRGASTTRIPVRASCFVSRLSSLVSLIVLSACSSSDIVERVPIPPGSTVRTAADSLSAHHVIRSTIGFRIIARLTHNRPIFAGIYRIARGTSDAAILTRLRSGDGEQFNITLPIGGTLFDLADAAERTLGIPPESLFAAARDTSLLNQFAVRGPSAEGWLLPETVNFGAFATAPKVIYRFLWERAKHWDTTWDARGKEAHLDRESLLSLASIVEAEAKNPAERPIIAAVYRNRMKIGMALQADPTIQYGYLMRDGERKPRLYNKDYLFDSPWNTYKHTGLPPGPIGNPSREAIEAVLSPAKVTYLYFVAGPDGNSLFANTMAEHLRNIGKVRKIGR